MEHENAKVATAERAAREKTWDECGIEEKVERLRHELRFAREVIEGQDRLIGALMNHRHEQDGQLVEVRPVGRGANLALAGMGYEAGAGESIYRRHGRFDALR